MGPSAKMAVSVFLSRRYRSTRLVGFVFRDDDGFRFHSLGDVVRQLSRLIVTEVYLVCKLHIYLYVIVQTVEDSDGSDSTPSNKSPGLTVAQQSNPNTVCVVRVRRASCVAYTDRVTFSNAAFYKLGLNSLGIAALNSSSNHSGGSSSHLAQLSA